MKRITLTKHICAAVVLGSLAVSSAHAQSDVSDVVDSVIQGWSGTATLGATTATGSSEANNVSASIRLGKTVGQWEHLVFGNMFQGTSALVINKTDANGEVILDEDGRPEREIIKGTNSDRLALGYQPRFYWRPKTYFFGILDAEKDKPAGIDLATRQVIGVGHKFYTDKTGFLSAEAGFGNKSTKVVSGDDIDGGIGYLGINYLNRFTDQVTLNADVRADLGGDNTYTEIGLGVAFKISETLALKVSHFTRGNTDVENLTNPGFSSSDSVTNINLVIDI